MHLFVIIETEEKYWIYVWFFCVKIQKGFYHFENLFWSKLNNSISHSSVSAWLSPISTPESIQSKPIFHPLVLIIVILGNGTSPYHLIHLKVIPWHNWVSCIFQKCIIKKQTLSYSIILYHTLYLFFRNIINPWLY